MQNWFIRLGRRIIKPCLYMTVLDGQEQLALPSFFTTERAWIGTDNQERCMCRAPNNRFTYLKCFKIFFNGLMLLWAALSNTMEAGMLSQRETWRRMHVGIDRCPGEGFGLWQEVGIRVQAKFNSTDIWFAFYGP